MPHRGRIYLNDEHKSSFFFHGIRLNGKKSTKERILPRYLLSSSISFFTTPAAKCVDTRSLDVPYGRNANNSAQNVRLFPETNIWLQRKCVQACPV